MSMQSEIQALEQDIKHAAASTKRRNFVSIVLALISMAGIGYWLYYAHTRFAEVTPEFAATYAQGQLTDYLPQAGADLESALKSNAPKFIDTVEEHLKAVPDKFADELESRTTAELDKAMPQIQDRLYNTLKQGLAQAKATAGATGKNDEEHAKATLDALANIYRDESIKVVDDLHNTYMKNGSDVVAYIKVLGDNKNLDRRQQLHRDMIQQFLIVAHEQGTPQVLPAPTK